jgi:hypothetical protein
MGCGVKVGVSKTTGESLAEMMPGDGGRKIRRFEDGTKSGEALT